ncbi:GNAT family N-acetyltransferase [Solimicrobium silvestre]|uniref:Acetyltransferase (GNAT) family n=1 Tax=Solimicrobium silvestre TaxID=2099400 RepID=A0A2S9GWI1_9BURK|nr:GNAT family N-acetyltransferase [Solimicrobium silvestre]PRC92085.1 Acetyltransferase (GNAT) family [Solimicrobium silvestre]
MFNIIEANLATPAHAAALVELLNHYAMDAMGGGEPLSDQVKNTLAAELHKRPTARVVLAFDGEIPAGLIICFEGFSTFACKPLLNLHDVVVHQSYRGKGLFRLMLQQVESIAQELGCCKLTMEVLEGNHVALVAYKANGFAGYDLVAGMGQAVFWQKKLF